MRYLAVFLLLVACSAVRPPCEPYGLRLSFGSNLFGGRSPERMRVMFDTSQACSKSYVDYQKDPLTMTRIFCNSTRLAFLKYTTYVHSCSLFDIQDGKEFSYTAVGWTGNDTDPKIPYKQSNIPVHFPSQDEQDFKMLLIADWGFLRKNPYNLTSLDSCLASLLSSERDIHALYIIGDIAYDLDSENGVNYQNFIVMISQVTARWPAIIVPGNHEHKTSVDELIYGIAFNSYGFDGKSATTVHLPWFNLLMFDPYYLLYEDQPVNEPFIQFLQELDKSDRLTIASSHYPLICNGPRDHCRDNFDKLSGYFGSMMNHNVPLYLSAHYHAFERHYPWSMQRGFMKINTPYRWNRNSAFEERYMISVVNGLGGNDKGLDETPVSINATFTAASSFEATGYGILTVNQYRINYQQYSTDKHQCRQIDQFSIDLSAGDRSHLRNEKFILEVE